VRVAVALPSPLSHTLNLSLEELVGETRKTAKPSKRGPAPKVRWQLAQIEALPKTMQRAIAQVLDSMLQSNA
jgi:hypothetical protein